MITGTFFIIGVGPGDPELMTVKAARLISHAPVVAYFAKRGQTGHARMIAATYISPASELLRLDYPFTTEIPFAAPPYQTGMRQFYNDSASAIAAHLDTGKDVALLCEGDPFFYGSSMYIFDRLEEAGYQIDVIPGITGMSGCWTRARLPMLHGDDVMSVLPATLPEADLTARLRACDAAVIMKVGSNLPHVRRALVEASMIDRAIYVERGTMAEERILKLVEFDQDRAPYFSLILVPGRSSSR